MSKNERSRQYTRLYTHCDNFESMAASEQKGYFHSDIFSFLKAEITEDIEQQIFFLKYCLETFDSGVRNNPILTGAEPPRFLQEYIREGFFTKRIPAALSALEISFKHEKSTTKFSFGVNSD